MAPAPNPFAQSLADLQQRILAQDKVVGSVVALIEGWRDHIQQLVTPRTDPDTVRQVQKMVAELDAQTANLSTAVAKGTSAESELQLADDDGDQQTDAGFHLDSISPNSGDKAGGGRITIKGVGLGDVMDVNFGGKSVDFQRVSDSELTATAPSQDDAGGSGSILVTVTKDSGDSNGLAYVYTDQSAQVQPAPQVGGPNSDSGTPAAQVPGSPTPIGPDEALQTDQDGSTVTPRGDKADGSKDAMIPDSITPPSPKPDTVPPGGESVEQTADSAGGLDEQPPAPPNDDNGGEAA